MFLDGFMQKKKQDCSIIIVLPCTGRKSKEKGNKLTHFLCALLLSEPDQPPNRFMVTTDSKSNYANQIIKASIFIVHLQSNHFQ